MSTTPPHLSAAPPEGRFLTGLLGVLWLGGTLFWWGLAFPPIWEAPPRWLAVVQAVCFGAEPGGLPAPYGWGALIAPPIALLAALVVGWGGEIAATWRPVWHRPAGKVLAVSVAGLVALQMGWVAWSLGVRMAPSPAAPGLAGTRGAMPEGYLRLAEPAPAFVLTNQRGAAVSQRNLRGRVTLLTFAFGHCATVCPTVVARLNAAAARPAALSPRIMVITLDAWRDTPSALEGIMRRWGLPASANLLSGPPATVNAVLDAFTVGRRRDEHTGQIDHPALVYVVDTQGRIAYALLDPSVGWLTEAARRAAKPPGEPAPS